MCVCGSQRVMSVSGKVSDMCFVSVPHLDIKHEGYAPGLGVGSGDYLKFAVCLDCGKIQNFTPQTDEDVREALES